MNRGHGIVKTANLKGRSGPTLICGPSERRIALLFSPPQGTGSYTVSTDPAVALGAGLNLEVRSGPLSITRELYGDATTRAWYGVASADMSVGYLETVDPTEAERR